MRKWDIIESGGEQMYSKRETVKSEVKVNSLLYKQTIQAKTKHLKFPKDSPYISFSLNFLCPTLGPENNCSGAQDNYTFYSIFKINPYLRGSFSQD